ncbi:acyltransferase family protein [Peribacillus simplex]|uniref:acyltransferase family protein n=1 Tax=Peribacillus simplex TaxID=1478 RepID=UPI0024BF5EE6|nr:acyltransferase family protein [Peribacillus simplex]WHY96086.1 OpgC domain-containing protein [Peribacillus simplex]
MQSGKRQTKRDPLFDYLRSICMAFVFLHHFYLTIPGMVDYAEYLNPFAEFFVGIAGFMVGFVYLNRNKDLQLLKRGIKILIAYYVVAIPIEIVISLVGVKEASLVGTIVNVVTFQQENNWVEILIFYGILFVLLPVILPIYRKNKSMVLVFSILLFLTSTIVSNLLNITNFFVNNTLMMFLQWQMFFVIGLKIGDLYKNKLFNPNKILKIITPIGVIALVIQWLWFHPEPLIKSPYSFEKLLNTLYLAPIYLFVLIHLYKIKMENSQFDRFIRVLGRNSLVAFIFSEYLRIALSGFFSFYDLKIGQFYALVLSLVLSFILILVLSEYEKLKISVKVIPLKPFSKLAKRL